MSAFTIEQIKESLDIWLKAERAIATSQSYQLGTRKLERADLGEVRRQIEFWKRELYIAEAQAAKRSSRRRIMRVMPRDL